MNNINFEPGDIVLSYGPRRTFKTIFTNFVQWAIRFFTTDFWVGEPFTHVHHAEMIYTSNGFDSVDITEEPPYIRLMDFGSKRKLVVRLINKPANFEELFDQYCTEVLGKKVRYDYIRFFAFVLDWMFRTVKFSRWLANRDENVCSGAVAKFYENRVWVPCSRKHWYSTVPDDIYDYVLKRPTMFVVVFDGREYK
jgi:hypothetical protein